MKKILLSIFTILALGANAQIVNIPDANFKTYLVGNSAINTNADAEIQVSEATAFTGTISVSFQGSISDLTGIEAFVNLKHLSCEFNLITNLDVTQNTALESLNCSSNLLTSLDISQNVALFDLSCNSNSLTSLDLTQNTALEDLECYSNSLTNLSISTPSNLNTVYCSGNQLSSLNLSGATALFVFDCTFNNLTTLDLSTNAMLQNLKCAGNSLTTLDLSNNTSLTYLECAENSLTSLDISNNLALTVLECFNNSITTLDLSSNTSLTEINCGENSLTTLDVSNNTALTSFWCYINPLTSLNAANGNNLIITTFSSHTIPSLTCIQVDDAAYSTTNWTDIDAASSFSTNCTVWNEINEDIKNEMMIYPNPATTQINIEIDKVIESVKIFNVAGELVMSTNKNTFSVSTLSNGVYVMNIQTSKGVSHSRFIKE